MRKRIRASAVCVHQERMLMVALCDPESGVTRWYPPGGEIEAGEQPVDTAIRETKEETGYSVRVCEDYEIVDQYPFRWNGVDYDCCTHYFGAVLAQEWRQPGPVSDADYHLGVAWKPISEVDKLLCFDSSIQGSVLAILRRKRPIL